MGEEQALSGGAQTEGIVRVGMTVRRPPHSRSAYTQALLLHLEQVGFQGAPRYLGLDERGRETLSYIPGETLTTSPVRLSPAQVSSAGRLVRDFHHATAGSPLAEAQEVVAHGDLGPHNIVFQGERASAIIDWDEDVKPGSRLRDLAHAVWCCADVCEPEIALEEQALKTRLMCEAYGWTQPASIIQEIEARFRRSLQAHQEWRAWEGVRIFQEKSEWMEQHGLELLHLAEGK